MVLITCLGVLTSVICLVNLKYLSPTQTLDVVYEGQCRRFSLASVSTMKGTVPVELDDLTNGLSKLSLQTTPQLWTVGWDTIVTLIDEKPSNDSAQAVCIYLLWYHFN